MSISFNLTGDSAMAFRAGAVKRPPVHPGAVAWDILKDTGLSVRAIATALGMKNTNLDKILKGQRPVTPETAVRFGAYFGNGPDLWLRLQADYDLYLAKAELAGEVKKIKPLAQP